MNTRINEVHKQADFPFSGAAGDVHQDLVDRVFDYLFQVSPGLVADIERNNMDVDDLKSVMRCEFGGRENYVKSQKVKEKKEKSEDNMRKVLREFNGRNATEVARKLGVSRSTVYRYLKQPGV